MLLVTSSKCDAAQARQFKPNNVINTHPTHPHTHSTLSVEKLDRIAAPVRKYAGRDDQKKFAKESEKVNCTFKPSKSKAAVSAMKSSDCGYDFLDNLEKDNSDFIKRMDAFENFRRRKFRRDQEEQYYNTAVDKKQCPNCGQLQSYDEWAEKRGNCTGEVRVRVKLR